MDFQAKKVTINNNPIQTRLPAIILSIFSLVVGTACTSSTTQNSRIDTNIPSNNSIIKNPVPAQIVSLDVLVMTGRNEAAKSIPKIEDFKLPEKQINTASKISQTAQSSANAVMDSIIWQIQTSQEKQVVIQNEIPQGPDLSLSDDALEAAFALLSGRSQPPVEEPVFQLPAKADNIIRVGLLAPFSGQHARLGSEIRQGVEMALFKIANANIEMIFLDTKAGENAGTAAITGLQNEVDIFIGPLFSKAVKNARATLGDKKIPMLLLSNNVDVASPDTWIMGYLPEQQLDGLMGHAVSQGKRRFAVVAQDQPFGQRLLAHTKRRLADFGIMAEAVLVLGENALADEMILKDTIRDFTRYVPPAEDGSIPDSPFDAVIFAGDPAFALRTAPVLAYYDVGPDRALYLGNSLWNQNQLLTEPSLQGGLFVARPSDLDAAFDADWANVWPGSSGLLARLGYDAMAVVGSLAQSDEKNWPKQLVGNQGFHGYSGAFRLLPNGRNVRAFELRKISNGGVKIIISAPGKI